jgi:outer membrane receptor protein involved in Fe transport
MGVKEDRTATESIFDSARVRSVVAQPFLVIAMTVGFATQTLAQVTSTTPSTASTALSGASDTLTEIIVTAQKRAENLQDVPIAITAVSGADLQAANVVTANDLPALVSGLSIGNTALYFQPHLRGIGTAAFGPDIENPVALYVDGVYYPSQLEAPTDLIDVSQISVLKGPQGTLFGRNSTGGVIQMTTKDPQQSFGGEAQTSLDNYITSRNYVYVTGGITADLAANASFRYTTQGNGWGRNVYNGEEVERDNKDLTARTKWVYTPAEETTVRLNMDYSNVSNSLGGNFAPAPGTKPLFPGYVATSNPYDIDSYQTGLNHNQNGGISLTVQQGLGFADFVSISSFRSYAFYDNLVVSLTPVPGINIDDVENGRDITEELQLVSKDNHFVQWATGIYLFHNEGSINPINTYLHGFLAPTPFSFGDQEVSDTLVTKSVAPYAQATVEVAPRWHITLGVRDTWEERTLNGSVSGFLENGIPIGLLAPYFNEGSRIDLPSYRAALDYKLTDDILAYLSYNRSFKSGGFNGNNPANAPYLPEVLNAYEIGLKSELLDHRLRVNLAPFYYDYKNIQVTNYIGALTNFYNGAAATLYGIDLDASFQVTKSLQLSATAEELHSDFTSFPKADFSTPLPFGGLAQYTASAAGNQLPYAPKFTFDIGGDYVVELAGEGTLDLNITNEYNSGYFTEADNYLHQPSYDFLNTSASWISPDARLTLKFWGRNLLNKAVESELVTGPPEGYTADYSNPPRTYGVTVLYKFGAQR